MSSRYISLEEITSVQAALSDQEGIELLKKIKENLNKEEDTEKFKKFNENKADLSYEELQKQSDEFSERKAFVGFAKEEDLGIKDPENKDVGKLNILNRLADKGLVLKGGYIPKNKARVNSYKLTNEGYALLALFTKIKEGRQEHQERERPLNPSPNQSRTQQQQQSSRR